MQFTVKWKLVSTGATVSEEVFAELEKAIDEAKFSGISGPKSVEVTVSDDNGQVHFSQIHAGQVL